MIYPYITGAGQGLDQHALIYHSAASSLIMNYIVSVNFPEHMTLYNILL